MTYICLFALIDLLGDLGAPAEVREMLVYLSVTEMMTKTGEGTEEHPLDCLDWTERIRG